MTVTESNTDLELTLHPGLAATLPEGMISAAPGWELVTVDFERGIDNPEVARSPVIGWYITREHTLPVLPWARYTEPVDMESEYNAYLCPDGTVVGGIHMRRFNTLQEYVNACVESEQLCRESQPDIGQNTMC